MKIEFTQKRGLNYRQFILTNEVLEIKTKTISKITNYEVRLDKIGYKKSYQSDNTLVGNIFLVICLLIPLLMIGAKISGADIETGVVGINAGLFGFLAVLNRIKQHQDDIILIGGEVSIPFYRKYPSKEEVLVFIETLIGAAKEYQKFRALDPALDLSPEMYTARVFWLRDNDIIDANELAFLLSSYEKQIFTMN